MTYQYKWGKSYFQMKSYRQLVAAFIEHYFLYSPPDSGILAEEGVVERVQELEELDSSEEVVSSEFSKADAQMNSQQL